jgi:valyl-tRNA synthetase
MIRNARAEYSVEPARRIVAEISAGDKYDLFMSQRDVLVELGRLDAGMLRIAHSLLDKPDQALTLMVGGVEIYLPLTGMIDLEVERARLQKELARVEEGVARSQNLLNNPGFIDKAPAEIVQKERDKLASLQQEGETLRGRLESLSA